MLGGGSAYFFRFPIQWELAQFLSGGVFIQDEESQNPLPGRLLSTFNFTYERHLIVVRRFSVEKLSFLLMLERYVLLVSI